MFTGGGGSGLFHTPTTGGSGLGLGGGMGLGSTGLGGGGGGLFQGQQQSTGFNSSLFSAASTAQSGLTGLGSTGTGLFNNTPQSQAKGLFSGTTGGGLGISSAGTMPSTSLFQTPLQNSLKLGGGQATGGLGGGGGIFNQTPGGLGGGGLGGGLAGGLGNTSLLGKQQQTGAGLGLGMGGGMGVGLFTGGGGAKGKGTAIVKFEPVKSTDTVLKNGYNQNVTTHLQCITGMKPYEDMSIEELRFDDYQANRKGPSATTGLFNPAGQGVLGMGAGASGGLFSQGLGATGGIQQQSSSIFNQQAKPSTGLFSQQSATGLGGGLGGGGLGAGGGLGLGAGGGLGQQSSGLFSKSTGQSGGLFSQQQTQQQGTGLFTQTSTAGAGLLGQSALGGGLLNKPQTGLGTGLGGGLGLGTGLSTSGIGTGLNTSGLGTSLNTGLQTSQAGGLGTGFFKQGGLGQTGGLGTSIGLGQTSGMGGGLGLGAGGGLGTGLGTTGLGLGQNRLGGGGGLGLSGMGTIGGLGTSVGGGLGTGLGATGGLGTGLGTGLSGGLGGLGGQSSLAQQSTFQSLTASQQQAQLQQQLQILANSPYGDNPLFRTAILDASKLKKNPQSTPVAHKFSSTPSPHYKLNIRPSVKFKPTSLTSPGLQKEKTKLFEGLVDSSTGAGNMTFVPRSSVKKLVIKPKKKDDSFGSFLHDSTTPTTTTSQYTPLSSTTTVISSSASSPPSKPAFAPTPSPLSRSRGKQDESGGTPELFLGSSYTNPVLKPVAVRPSPPVNNTMQDLQEQRHIREEDEEENQTATNGNSTPVSSFTLIADPNRPCGVVLQRPEYYIRPSLDQLDQLAVDGKCLVTDFTIGRSLYGEILFPGSTDVFGMNLDELVQINPKEVTVYSDDTNKPDVGKGLNKRAVVMLDGYWPLDKTTRQPIKDPEHIGITNYVATLRRSTSKIGARFLDYIPLKGTCVFEVDHFSKYKLVADDDDGSETEGEAGVKKPRIDGKGKGKENIRDNQSTQPHPPLLQPPEATKQQQTAGQAIGFRPPAPPVSSLRMEQDEIMSEDIEDEREEEEFQDAADDGGIMIEKDFPRFAPSQQMATELGLDTHRMQVMKASFFTDEEHGMSKFRRPATQQQSKRGTVRFAGPPVGSRFDQSLHSTQLYRANELFSDRVHSRGVTPSDVMSVTTPSLLSASIQAPHELQAEAQATLVVPRHDLSGLVCSTRTLSMGNTRSLTDAGLFLNRSFRVGWGPNWTLAHWGIQLAPSVSYTSSVTTGSVNPLPTSIHQSDAEEEGLKFRVLIEKVDSVPWMREGTSNKEAQFEMLLRVHLRNSVVREDEQTSIPHYSPVSNQCLLDQVCSASETLAQLEFEPNESKQFLEVFQLVKALWGREKQNIDQVDEDDTLCAEDHESYAYKLSRRQALSQWLMGVSRPTAEEQLKQSDPEHGYLSNLFSLLSRLQLSAACRLAHENRDHKLGLLISQSATSSHVNKLSLRQQLEEWKRQESTRYMKQQRLRVYVLLAGFLEWVDKDHSFLTCEGLDWRRTLAVLLWFASQPSDTIEELMLDYVKSFKDESGPVVCPPVSPYYHTQHFIAKQEEEEDERKYDTCFHLLQLYCCRDHSLESILSPSGSTQHHLDYRLSWSLWAVLSSLGYDHSHCSKLAELHISFAAELESSGLWHWAVFVLLHLEDPERKETVLLELLCRQCSSCEEPEEKEKFIIEELNLSPSLVYFAKAQKAEYEGSSELQALHLISAGLWNKAHTIILHHIAAGAFTNGQTVLLETMLTRLSEPEVAAEIQNWETGGSVYFDFLRMSRKISELSQVDAIPAYQLEDLYVGLRAVAARINQLPANSPEENLCKSEMSKQTAGFIRLILSLKSAYDRTTLDEVEDVVDNVCSLPMPADYASTELRQLSYDYLIAAT